MKIFVLIISTIVSSTLYGQTSNELNLDSLVQTIKDKKLLKYVYKVEDSIVRENIIGKWKDENSTIIFSKDGTAITTWDTGFEMESKWRIKKRVLTFESTPPGPGANASNVEYYILYSSPTKMEYQLLDKKRDSTIWHAIKIE